jgi:hypothetical protein
MLSAPDPIDAPPNRNVAPEQCSTGLQDFCTTVVLVGPLAYLQNIAHCRPNYGDR